MAVFSPAPSRMIVSSFDTVTFFAVPSIETSTCSSLYPRSSLITTLPVRMAISWRLLLRLSPNPGAFWQIYPPLSLFTMSVASASDSTSSATISSGRCVFNTASGRAGGS